MNPPIRRGIVYQYGSVEETINQGYVAVPVAEFREPTRCDECATSLDIRYRDPDDDQPFSRNRQYAVKARLSAVRYHIPLPPFGHSDSSTSDVFDEVFDEDSEQTTEGDDFNGRWTMALRPWPNSTRQNGRQSRIVNSYGQPPSWTTTVDPVYNPLTRTGGRSTSMGAAFGFQRQQDGDYRPRLSARERSYFSSFGVQGRGVVRQPGRPKMDASGCGTCEVGQRISGQSAGTLSHRLSTQLKRVEMRRKRGCLNKYFNDPNDWAGYLDVQEYLHTAVQ